jgi:hypothetical protein
MIQVGALTTRIAYERVLFPSPEQTGASSHNASHSLDGHLNNAVMETEEDPRPVPEPLFRFPPAA